MMLFNKEDGKEKVYVQYQDLMELINGDFNFSIPCFLIDKLFKNDKALLVDDSNRWKFVEFDKEEEVEFFRKQAWIVNFKEIRGKSFDELLSYSNEIARAHDVLVKSLNDLDENDEKNINDIYKKLKMFKSKYHMLPECCFVMKGYNFMPFPVVVDSDGYDCGSNMEYEAKSSLDPNKIIIRRKDGQPLNKGRISKRFIKNVIANGAINMNEARASYCTTGKAKYTISEDGMCIVITYSVNPILSKEEMEYKQNNTFVKRMKRKLFGEFSN